MDILLACLAFLLSIVGIIGCILPALPGTIFSYGALLCAYATSYSQLSPSTLWIWAAVSAAVILADYVLPAWFTRRFGGSRAGAMGATIGVFAGLFLAPPIGLILGPFVGAVVGELLHNGEDKEKAVKVGVGSFLSFIVGTGLKLICSIWMFYLLVADTWTPLKTWFATIF